MACMTQAPYMNNNLSAEAPVFVPSWEPQPHVQPPAAGGCCLISLGAYSDDSSDEEEHNTPAPAPAPAPAVVEDLRSRRPWRVSAPEFVPRGMAAPESLVIEEPPTTKDLGSPTQSPWWRRGRSATESDTPADGSETPTKNDDGSSGKSPPWRRSISATPKTVSSSTTLSTSEGTPSPAGSVDDTSSDSTASCASRSRSPTPPPAAQDQVCKTFPFELNALLLWRGTPSEQPEELLPTAQEPDAGTSAAAWAAAAQKLALGVVEEAAPVQKAEKSWRTEVSPPKKLEVSDDSWVARQAARRNTKPSSGGGKDISDEEVVRTVKSILNKLTVEKFESLSVQLLNCGISSTKHLEILIQEVFEKATTQHHFIDMYADLCDLLNIHFSEHCVLDDPKKNFKKVLLHCCQASFEKHLTPPKGLAALNHEDRTAAERLYKMRMLGNIKFVGALLVRKMLASKVMLAIMEELLQSPTPEALESLAALLTVVGPTFDTPDWAYRVTLNAIFSQIEKIIKKDVIDPRVRCILQDVLDLRNQTWKDRKPKKIEGPLKLEEVAAKAAAENGYVQKAPSYSNDWYTVDKDRMGKICSLLGSKTTSPGNSPTSGKQQVVQPKAQPEKTAKNTGAGAAMLAFLKNRDQPEKAEQSKDEAPQKLYNKEECQKEISATLAELRVSHDVPEAIVRIANIAVPVANQAGELEYLLGLLVEEGSQGTRKVGFDLATGLIQEGYWKKQSAAEGLTTFVEEICPDLKFDVPALPRILRDELHPALGSLVKAGLLEADQQNALLAF